jgi:hypothetical protein
MGRKTVSSFAIIQDLRTEADDEHAALRSWLVAEIQLYWTMRNEILIKVDKHDHEEDLSREM